MQETRPSHGWVSRYVCAMLEKLGQAASWSGNLNQFGW
jgi:hypothetical protein